MRGAWQELADDQADDGPRPGALTGPALAVALAVASDDTIAAVEQTLIDAYLERVMDRPLGELAPDDLEQLVVDGLADLAHNLDAIGTLRRPMAHPTDHQEA